MDWSQPLLQAPNMSRGTSTLRTASLSTPSSEFLDPLHIWNEQKEAPPTTASIAQRMATSMSLEPSLPRDEEMTLLDSSQSSSDTTVYEEYSPMTTIFNAFAMQRSGSHTMSSPDRLLLNNVTLHGSMALPALGNQDGLSTVPTPMILMLRVVPPNGGTATMDNPVSFSTTSAEASANSASCLRSWTCMPIGSRSREVSGNCVPQGSSSLPRSSPTNATSL